MKTIYALLVACLPLQACIGQSETATAVTNINEYSSIVEYAAVVPLYDDYTAAINTPPAIKPIDGAEFEGTSRDSANTPWVASPELRDEIDAWTGNFDYADIVTASKPAAEKPVDLFATGVADDNTASVNLPAPAAMWDYADGDFYVGADELYAIQAKDWW
jgi:hypothetical protein